MDVVKSIYCLLAFCIQKKGISWRCPSLPTVEPEPHQGPVTERSPGVQQMPVISFGSYSRSKPSLLKRGPEFGNKSIPFRSEDNVRQCSCGSPVAVHNYWEQRHYDRIVNAALTFCSVKPPQPVTQGSGPGLAQGNIPRRTRAHYAQVGRRHHAGRWQKGKGQPRLMRRVASWSQCKPLGKQNLPPAMAVVCRVGRSSRG